MGRIILDIYTQDMTQGEWFVINILGGLTLWGILEYFGMTQETLIILTVMLILDRVFGIVDAYIQETLESKLMVTGLVKKLTRWCIPFIVIAVIRGAGFDNIDLISTTILSILIVAEWYSVIGHIYSINYKEKLPELDALKLLLQRLGKLFKWKVEETLPPKDEEEWKKNDNTESQEQI